jgi:hypothetical protein
MVDDSCSPNEVQVEMDKHWPTTIRTQYTAQCDSRRISIRQEEVSVFARRHTNMYGTVCALQQSDGRGHDCDGRLFERSGFGTFSP